MAWFRKRRKAWFRKGRKAWFRKGKKADSPAGSALPLGRVEFVGDLDPGAAAVRYIFDVMRIDAEWSVREERGFTWWGHSRAQRVWAEPGVEDGGFVVYRLHAQADVLRNVDVSADVLGKVNALNALCLTSALVADPDTRSVRYAASMWVHEETLEWVSRLFSSVVVLQATHANEQAERFAEMLGGEPAVSAHPESGRRDVPDDMLRFIENVVATGQEPSCWRGAEMASFVEILNRPQSFVVLANGDDEGVTAEFPLFDDTILLQADTRPPHPSMGSGMLVRLSLPESVRDEDGGSWANNMNQRELASSSQSHFLGSWVVGVVENRTPTFVTFYPSKFKMVGGDIQNLVLSVAVRAKWIADVRGDDWSRPGRLDEARARKLAELERLVNESRSDEHTE